MRPTEGMSSTFWESLVAGAEFEAVALGFLEPRGGCGDAVKADGEDRQGVVTCLVGRGMDHIVGLQIDGFDGRVGNSGPLRVPDDSSDSGAKFLGEKWCGE